MFSLYTYDELFFSIFLYAATNPISLTFSIEINPSKTFS
ncbi:hypothetical protein BBU72A_I0039 (plasmid) [Borreliella burgdorferi 72a]|nr:hypothetical protein BBU72A_I0039 [Borreliella burgdorferi 72a]